MTPDRFGMPLRVRYVECDMQGRVFNGHYLTWFDMAINEAIRDIFGDYQVLLDGGIDFVVAAAELQFRQPARFDDELVVGVGFEPVGRTSLSSRFAIRRGADLIAEATMIHVCVDAVTFEKRPWPDWFRERMSSAC
ncbi:acyl-CoA thioesterase [Mycolicibacterium aichiense]|uniref:4-hydroxybenzoyl-CoA thioesterase n=1 Tax=Mycolicibacterium aichiense TaxID=1799 RepID=A0AAD1HLF4_9MYCO|nr:thioesterase family protein [Mycolicibacterium aichiense]MCV7019199.1 acyl-CoA thioesterase [Mycolicibacterium aichiense]BBX06351.1 4-hydroxybenzoyl-CoA thioesterase [Mycolicibacterium aichiense]STZ24310.1 thioesterase superfamily protein [Mycolicibacterium aichiense]